MKKNLCMIGLAMLTLFSIHSFAKSTRRPRKESCLHYTGWAFAACVCSENPQGEFMGKPCTGRNGWIGNEYNNPNLSADYYRQKEEHERLKAVGCQQDNWNYNIYYCSDGRHYVH